VGALVQAYSNQFDNGRYEEQNQDGSKINVGCKLISKAQKIVDKYYGKHDRLFPFYQFKYNPQAPEFENIRRSIKQKESATSYINRYIKKIMALIGINKKISTHNARHTFARMAVDKVSNPMLSMDLLGHKSLAVHQQYLNDIRKDDVLDAAADDIFG
jgi:integrase/recombinase XerD